LYIPDLENVWIKDPPLGGIGPESIFCGVEYDLFEIVVIE
jgi:hypothetical protein